MSIHAFFRRFTHRDPLVVTVNPYVDLRPPKEPEPEEPQETLEQIWRRRVKENELRRAEKRAMRYVQQA